MSELENLRKRLEALNRSPLASAPGGGSAGEIVRLRRRLRAAPDRVGGRTAGVAPGPPALPRGAPPDAALMDSEPPIRLEEAIEGAETAAPHGGVAYLIATPLRELAEEGAAFCETFRKDFPANALLQRRLRKMGVRDASAADVLLMDIETTGLNCTPLFLIGTMGWEGDGLVSRQYLARDYAEERAVISLFLAALAGRKLLVTFNGKSFDVPYVRMRAVATGVPFPGVPPHLDLLHEARRSWKGKTPDCRLKTLEALVCGRQRGADIPGAAIPDAYHAFVRTANAARLVEILRHNMFDLVTLADLMTRLGQDLGADTGADADRSRS